MIAGSGYATNTGDGINITDNQPGTILAGITVDQVAVSGFGHVGLHLVGTDGLISGVSITYASVHDNGYGGLAVEARGNHAADLYIGHVQAYHNAGAGTVGSGYGILVVGASNVVVERSVAHDNGWLPGNGGETGGGEAIQCERVLLQYNESYANRCGTGSRDGGGFDLDGGVTNSLLQYNYSHDNNGAGRWKRSHAFTHRPACHRRAAGDGRNWNESRCSAISSASLAPAARKSWSRRLYLSQMKK